VLIIDDNADKRALLGCILRRHFDVFEAKDGCAGLAGVETHDPDVILLDVLMPGLDGFEVCQRLKADPQRAEIPVLFVTVLDQDQNRVAGLDLGAEDFINWPVNASELVAHQRPHSLAGRSARCATGRKQSQVIEAERQREAATEFELEQARLVQQRFISPLFPRSRACLRALLSSEPPGGR
jgi:DNA-binding response OmpR family regulator